MAISKIKTLLRKQSRRMVETLSLGISEAIDAITLMDARGFIKHCESVTTE